MVVIIAEADSLSHSLYELTPGLKDLVDCQTDKEPAESLKGINAALALPQQLRRIRIFP